MVPVTHFLPGERPNFAKNPTVDAEVGARLATAMLLEEWGDKEDADEVGRRAAAQTFQFITEHPEELKGPATDAHAYIAQLQTPEAVRTLVAMLTQYEWNFVKQADEIRNFCMATLLDTAANAKDQKTKLRAVELLGKVTEVALFTERIDANVTTKHDPQQLDDKITEKLKKLGFAPKRMHADEDVIDVELKELNKGALSE
jgi:hypothetical protein